MKNTICLGSALVGAMFAIACGAVKNGDTGNILGSDAIADEVGFTKRIVDCDYDYNSHSTDVENCFGQVEFSGDEVVGTFYLSNGDVTFVNTNADTLRYVIIQ